MPHEVRMPVLSQSMIQGRVVEWLLKEGDKINKGALLVVVESDKATHELEAPQAGILSKILVETGVEVDVNTPIAIITEIDEENASLLSEKPSQALPVGTSGSAASPAAGGRKPVSPAARRLAQELKIDLTLVPGTGEDGLITEKDLRLFASQHTAPAASELRRRRGDSPDRTKGTDRGAHGLKPAYRC